MEPLPLSNDHTFHQLGGRVVGGGLSFSDLMLIIDDDWWLLMITDDYWWLVMMMFEPGVQGEEQQQQQCPQLSLTPVLPPPSKS